LIIIGIFIPIIFLLIYFWPPRILLLSSFINHLISYKICLFYVCK
jgi:hypothetical protein